jgi:hypothetical protein
MGINFPSAPAINDLYPTPAVAGIPQYKWNGAAWVAIDPASQFVAKGGDTMTGLLVLSGNPSAALHAAPKQYIDGLFVQSDTPPSSPTAQTQWFDTVGGQLYIRFGTAWVAANSG